ncbi:extracellular solute-binding protein [Streptomyces sp. B6B3]|uniref:extracellular solute-binding protein n=1 Tax=Streptomyces sp. B6B3 TaxID=3153570 RepID=UPI00325D4C86
MGRTYRGGARRPRTLAVGLTAVVAATSLAACGSSGSGGESLDVWVYQDASTAVQVDFVERFNEESDIDINLVQVPGDDYQDRMRTAMGGSNAPDLFFNWGAGSLSDFVAEDMIIDLTDELEADLEFKNSFIPTILEGAMVDGRYYGIPMRGVQPVLLFYNQTLFDEVGAEPPETFDDFLALVDLFQQEGVTPVALGGGDAWTELMWMEVLLDRYGGSEVFQRIQDGETEAWGDPAMEWAAETVTDLVDRGTFGDNFRSVLYTDDAVSTYFASGDAAMHLMGSWEYPNQLANQPEFAENDLAYTTFPLIEEGVGHPGAVVGNPTNYWSVNSNLQAEGEEDRLEAAMEFLRMCASPEYSEALIANGDVPATSDAQALLENHSLPEYAQFQYDVVSQAPTFQLSWDQAVPASQKAPMTAAIQKLFAGQMSPEEFVDEMLAL